MRNRLLISLALFITVITVYLFALSVWAIYLNADEIPIVISITMLFVIATTAIWMVVDYKKHDRIIQRNIDYQRRVKEKCIQTKKSN